MLTLIELSENTKKKTAIVTDFYFISTQPYITFYISLKVF